MKAFFKSLICLSSLILLLPALVQAQFTFTTNNGSLTITSFSGTGSVSVPSSTNGYAVTEIGDAAFYSCSNLTRISIANSITNIGENAFLNCYNLTNITIPNSVVTIEGWAFCFCTNLVRVMLPNGVSNLGDAVFQGCTSLTHLTIPGSVDYIGIGLCNACPRLTAIDVESNNAYFSSAKGVLFDKNFTTIIQFPNAGSGIYSIPDSVTSIDDWAFCNCSMLTGVIIPGGVTNLGNSAFSSCPNLTNINIPGAINSIGEYAFYQCSQMTNVTIANGIAEIGMYAFACCYSLGSMTIPQSINNIQPCAFENCTNLTSIYFNGNSPSVGATAFTNDDKATVYYFAGATGWGSPFAGLPAVMLNLGYPPSISLQPTNQVLATGNTLSLEVSANGTTPLNYQWRNSRGIICGQTNNTLLLNPALTNYTDNYSVVVSNLFGAVTSQVATVVIYSPVCILRQPCDQIAQYGSSVTFGVSASDFPFPVSYQWLFNGTNLPEATSSTYTINSIRLADGGSYQVLLSNGYNATNSRIVALHIAPTITTPFQGSTAIWGQGATLAIGAVGSGTLTYQWYFNGQVIRGATEPGLEFTNITFTNAGLYTVVVNSVYGSVTNLAEQVIVNPAGVSLGFYPGLTISGVTGYSYVIQSSTDLADIYSWQTLTNLLLTSPTQLWIDKGVDASSPFNSKVFYRVLPGQ